MALVCGGFQTRFFADSAPLINRIADLFRPMSGAGAQGEAALSRLEIVRDTPGFTLVLDGKVERSRLPLSNVTQALSACLASHAAGNGDIAIDAGLVASPCESDESFLISNSDPALRDALALALAERWVVDRGRGALLQSGKDATVQSLGLPLQQSPDQGAGCVPASEGAIGLKRRLKTVLIPSKEQLDSVTGVQSLGVNDALKYLIASCCAENGRPLDTAGFTRLSEWLEGCERYLVDMNNLDAAAAALSSEHSVAEMQKASGGQ
jgi:tubulin polyglutamylase TTLL5